MLCSRCVLPLLALYMSLEELSAAVLPNGSRNKREVSWPDEELFHRLEGRPDAADLPVGDAEEMGREVKSRPSQSEAVLAPTERLSVRRQNQHQYHRKASEKRRKVAPLDSISSFQMSSFRKDEPERHWEDYWD